MKSAGSGIQEVGMILVLKSFPAISLAEVSTQGV
jgi:hypothetical protein